MPKPKDKGIPSSSSLKLNAHDLLEQAKAEEKLIQTLYQPVTKALKAKTGKLLKYLQQPILIQLDYDRQNKRILSVMWIERHKNKSILKAFIRKDNPTNIIN